MTSATAAGADVMTTKTTATTIGLAAAPATTTIEAGPRTESRSMTVMLVRVLALFAATAVMAVGLTLLFHDDAPLFGAVAAVVVALVPGWLLALEFGRRAAAVGEAVDRFERGDFSHRVSLGSDRTSQVLARRLEAMAAGLASRIQRLEGERHQLMTVLEGMAEGVIAIGPGQRVLFANVSAGEILQFDPLAAADRPLWEIARQRAIHDLLDRTLQLGAPQREAIETRTSPARNLSIYVAPLAGDDGPGAVLVLEDTSELKRLEKVRQEFVANVSHELKTPLAIIQGCTEALQDGAVDDPEVRGPFLQQVADQAARLHALILDLLSLARLESGEGALEFESVSVRQAVAECLERHRPRAEAKGMQLEAIPGDNDCVWADADALGQILDNLVDNAIKYTQADGAVRVGWAECAEGVRIDVADNGPGIPDRDLPRIFERFYRVDRARSRELGGTGLGLSIVKHLSQAMGGTARAASTVGQGTVISVCLPRPTEEK